MAAPDPDAYPSLSPVQVGELLSVSAEQVRRKIRAGEWRAYRVCGRWRMTQHDVDAIAYGEPNTPTQREPRPPRRRRVPTSPSAPGSLARLDEIERAAEGTR